MKKWMFLTIILGAMALQGWAQDDDMYYVPTRQNVARDRATYGIPSGTYYSGSRRSVDEYNRRGSMYEVLPPDSSDIIMFSGGAGVYPDSLSDFALTQQMERWDGYEPSSAYWAGYAQGRLDWSWHSPWYYSSYWYDPWYYDPWYWGWYDPWYGYYGWGGYYGYYSYYRPWYYGNYFVGIGGGGLHARNYPGTENHGRISGAANRGYTNGRTHSYSAGTFGGSRTVRNGSFGTNSSVSRGSNTGTRTRTATNSVYSNSNGNFGGSRSSGSTPSYTPSTSSGGSSGGSFGGSSGGGGGGGGGSRSGGGSFGGGRR